MKRRLRATFLLKLVVALSSLAVVVLVVSLLALHPITLAVVAAVVVFWVLAFEFNLLPEFLEALLLRHSARSNDSPLHSIWFVDTEAESRRERERFSEQTKDNPTVR